LHWGRQNSLPRVEISPKAFSGKRVDVTYMIPITSSILPKQSHKVWNKKTFNIFL